MGRIYHYYVNKLCGSSKMFFLAFKLCLPAIKQREVAGICVQKRKADLPEQLIA